jgi:hypothetical protein
MEFIVSYGLEPIVTRYRLKPVVMRYGRDL